MECKKCKRLSLLNRKLIQSQLMLIREFKGFMRESIQTNREVLGTLDEAIASLDSLYKSFGIKD